MHNYLARDVFSWSHPLLLMEGNRLFPLDAAIAGVFKKFSNTVKVMGCVLQARNPMESPE